MTPLPPHLALAMHKEIRGLGGSNHIHDVGGIGVELRTERPHARDPQQEYMYIHVYIYRYS